MQKPLYKRGFLLVRYLMIVVVVLGAATFVSPAAAEHPIMWEETWSNSYEDTSLCPFSVTVEANSIQTLTAFVNDSGEWVMGHHHAVEQDTLSANGKTLVSMPYTYTIHNFFEPNPDWPILTHGSYQGIGWKFHLPDGSMFISAGRVEWDADGNITSITGVQGDTGPLCAALAP